jgi:hypothetical protein
MAKSTTKASDIINLISQGQTVDQVKASTSSNDAEWYGFSNKAYNLSLDESKKERKKNVARPNVSTTSSEDISTLLTLNETLADYALAVPAFATMGEFKAIEDLAKNLPNSESQIIGLVGKMILDPRMRALQKKGRIEKFQYFKVFSKIIDAAIISYYRTNFISCYLTLIPIIEGVIIRWMGYNETQSKPEFEDIRKFFKNSAVRQPCPFNIQFHNIFVKACDKILNNHFYKPTTLGRSYSNFNRHVGSHLLNDDHFATKENCIRLFMLLDIMTEIYLYESRGSDPRFNLTNQEISADILYYNMILIENLKTTPENLILNTTKSDLNM